MDVIIHNELCDHGSLSSRREWRTYSTHRPKRMEVFVLLTILSRSGEKSRSSTELATRWYHHLVPILEFPNVEIIMYARRYTMIVFVT